MDAIAHRLARMGRFLWSAWAGVAALAMLAVAWQVGHERYGSFILPSPLVTLQSVQQILRDEGNWTIAATTLMRALQGFAVAAAIGTTSGVVAGYSAGMLRLARPTITFLLGVPPIAWIVLAMIWFGSTSGMVVSTVVIGTLPVLFVGAAEGAMTRDRGLDAMARAFGASAAVRFLTVSLRHVAAHVMPSLVIALGTAFKIAVMAEVLANTGGIGGSLARARANLDVAEALGWVLIAISALLVVEYGVLHPIRSELERWREAAQPWGIKR